MAKFELSLRYPFFRQITARAEELLIAARAENEAIRGKLIAAQDQKVKALGQSEELRDEKERLRQRVASLKKELADEQRIGNQLRDKVQTLQEEIKRLSP